MVISDSKALQLETGAVSQGLVGRDDAHSGKSASSAVSRALGLGWLSLPPLGMAAYGISTVLSVKYTPWGASKLSSLMLIIGLHQG
ncbi:MAG: hypothetical protein EB115_12050 [Betaproteobacteria bacterium]|nr:hypothetical protein [Betaproteobacteria bacterium]